MTVPTKGEVATVERTFTHEDVERFASLSRDRGEHHLDPDEEGRVVVHGLLLATLPTEVGGERDVLARTMSYEFHRPAYTGERITCEVTTESVTEREGRYEIRSSAICVARSETVMTATYDGVILTE